MKKLLLTALLLTIANADLCLSYSDLGQKAHAKANMFMTNQMYGDAKRAYKTTMYWYINSVAECEALPSVKAKGLAKKTEGSVKTVKEMITILEKKGY